MNWRYLPLALIGLFLAVTLVTATRLYAATERWHNRYSNEAGVAAGQVYEASQDLEPVAAPFDADDRDRILRAVLKLETAYAATYDLEISGQLPGGPRRWSESINVLQGPLRSILIYGDSADLPVVKQRLADMAGLVPPGQGDPLAKLQAARSRLDGVFAP